MASTASGPPAPSAPLHSDHVNYLIWRYLQERGYGHAAVQLMRDWNSDPSRLPFACDVNPHDLVSIIQDGIMFDDLSANVESRDKKYQFTVEKKRKASQPTPDSLLKPNDPAHPRKRPKLDHRNGTGRSLSDRARSRNIRPDANAMDVDQNGESPLQIQVNDVDMKLEEPPVVVSTLSKGESTGIQQPPLARSVARLRVPGADILDVSWSLGDDPELVATGGSIWRSWKWSKLSASLADESSEPQCTHHAPSEGVFSVSASARDRLHRIQASAFADKDGSVILLDLDGEEPRRVLTNHHGTATLLRWDFSDSRLLVVSQKSDSNEVSIWKTDDSTCLAFVDTSQVVEDAAWAHDDHFVLCGQGFLLLHKLPFQNSDQQSPALETPVKSISTDSMWAFIKYDPRTKRAACVAPDEGEIAILDIEDFAFQTKAVHSGQITAIEWDDSFQDPSTWDDSNKMRLLFSSSTDGTVKVWNARSSLECLFSLSLSSGIPAMTLAVHKEYIAAAGDGQISVWKLRWPSDSTESPRAEETTVWHAPSEGKEGAEHRIGWPVDEAPFHKISWQSQHNLLAYSAGNDIHVVQIP